MKRNGCLFKLLLVIAVLVAPWYAVRAGDKTPWVKVLDSVVDLTLADSYGCTWTGIEGLPPTLNLPGMCGRPEKTSLRFMIYAHTLHYCDRVYCRWSREAGNSAAWPALVRGDKVKLFDGARVWAGRVLEVIPRANRLGIEAYTEFKCPNGGACGTLTTCAGDRAALAGIDDFAVVRFVVY